MTDKSKIIEELNKAREGKAQKVTRVDGDLIATIQISKRGEGGSDKPLSEMSLYEVEGKCYLVLHENKKHPDPEKVLKGEGNIIVKKITCWERDIVNKGIICYRGNHLEEYYVNTYSYICGWCLANGFDIHKLLD